MCRLFCVFSFTTIKNHNTLKLIKRQGTDYNSFTTIKNHSTLKQWIWRKTMPVGFTTIKNHSTLKRVPPVFNE